MKKKKVLILGGRGFIGQNLVNKLIKDPNNEIVIIDNLSTDTANKNVNDIPFNVKLFIHDILDIDTLKHQSILNGFDTIYHLAALARIQPSFEQPVAYCNTNIQGTIKVCEYARKHGSKVIYAGSSSSNYDQYANPYTFSKWSGEQVLKMYRETYGLDCITARFFNVYGKYQSTSGPYATVLGIFMDQYKNGRPLTVTGDGNQKRDFTHVDDIVNGLIAMDNGRSNKNEIYDLGRGMNISIKALAKLFNTKIEYIPERKGEVHSTLANIKQSITDLDWKPKENIYEYVNDWLKNN